jgi:glycosyltransferase involved in cell wall biosynthesis
MPRPPKTVLSVLPDAPFPAITGLQIRLATNLRVVRELAGRSHVLWFAEPDAERDIEALAAACDEAVFAGSPVPYASFSVRTRVGQRLRFVMEATARRRGRRYPMSLTYDEAGAEALVRDEVRRVAPDFVLLPIWFAHYAPALAADGRQVIIDAYDVLTEQTLNMVKSYGLRHPARLPGLLANHVGTRAQERLCLPASVEVWVNSEAQAERLRRLVPDTRTVVVGNVLDENDVEASPPPDGPTVGFIGAYGYPPNLAAAQHLAREVFPRLRRRVPEARLLLAGGGMDDRARAGLASVAGVEVLGRVPDSGAFMSSCAAMAFPLFFRSGPPLKVVEALARGRPVVASPQIAEALELTDGRDALVARKPAAAAEALANLLTDRSLAAGLAAEGRRVFEERFSLGATIGEARRHSVLGRAQRPDQIEA